MHEGPNLNINVASVTDKRLNSSDRRSIVLQQRHPYNTPTMVLTSIWISSSETYSERKIESTLTVAQLKVSCGVEMS